MWDYGCNDNFDFWSGGIANNDIQNNRVLDVTRTLQPSQPEPVTATEAQAYLKISTDFDNPVITQLITEGRQWIEHRCGISVLKHDVVAELEIYNRQELPYGPITGTITMKDKDDAVITTGFTKLGLQYPRIQAHGRFTASYVAGFDIVPTDIKGAILSYVAFYYENRGDNIYKSDDQNAKDARSKSDPYKRVIGF